MQPGRCDAICSNKWIDQTAKHDTPFGSIHANQNTSHRQARAFDPALELSFDNVPHNISRSNVRSATIRFNLLFSSSRSRNRRISDGIRSSYLFGKKTVHRTLFFSAGTPIEIRSRTNSRLAANLRKRRALIALFNNKRLLDVREFGYFHRFHAFF